MLYQRKYEINSYPFVIFSSLAGAYAYLLLFGRASIFQAGVCSVLATVLFTIGGMVKREGGKNKNYT
jgi:hypothetical protein